MDRGTQRPSTASAMDRTSGHPIALATDLGARCVGGSRHAAALRHLCRGLGNTGPATRGVPCRGERGTDPGPHRISHGPGGTGLATLVDQGTQRPSTAFATDLGTPVPGLGWLGHAAARHRLCHRPGNTGPATWVVQGTQRPPSLLPRTGRHRSRDLGGSRNAAAPIAVATDSARVCVWSPAGANAERTQDPTAAATDLGAPVPLLRWIKARSGPPPPLPRTWWHRSRYFRPPHHLCHDPPHKRDRCPQVRG